MRSTKYRSSSPSSIKGQNYRSLPRSWMQYHLLKIVRDGLHFLNYRRIKKDKQWRQRSNERANYRIPRTVLCPVTTILNQTTTSANLRYVKFCSCISHSQNKLCVVFRLSFSLKRLRFLTLAGLWENTAIFTNSEIREKSGVTFPDNSRKVDTVLQLSNIYGSRSKDI